MIKSCFNLNTCHTVVASIALSASVMLTIVVYQQNQIKSNLSKLTAMVEKDDEMIVKLYNKHGRHDGRTKK